MLCPSVFQSSPMNMNMSASPYIDFHWPVRSLWPETSPLFYQMEQEMMRNMQEMRHNMEYMERLHKFALEKTDHSDSSSAVYKPIAFQMGKEGNRFALTLDTKDFSPEELSVKQVGRKLKVSGKTEKKQEDGQGSFSYRCQEFRQEFDLPEGVNPETVTCSLAGGQLQIQAPREAVVDGKERVVSINFTSAPAVTSTGAQSPGAESTAATRNASS